MSILHKVHNDYWTTNCIISCASVNVALSKVFLKQVSISLLLWIIKAKHETNTYKNGKTGCPLDIFKSATLTITFLLVEYEVVARDNDA